MLINSLLIFYLYQLHLHKNAELCFRKNFFIHNTHNCILGIIMPQTSVFSIATCMHRLSLKTTRYAGTKDIHPTFVSTGNTESGVMIDCGKERLVWDGDLPRPVEEVRDARIMQHLVHEPALYHYVHGALYRCDAMWRRPCFCPPVLV